MKRGGFINNHAIVYKRDNYVFLYFFITIFYSLIYIIGDLPEFLQSMFMAITYCSQLYLFIAGIKLLNEDYKRNRLLSVVKLPYFKYIVGFVVLIFGITLFQGTTFATFNNFFYVIHSILFFLVLLIYGDKYKWIETIVKLSWLFVVVLSIFTVSTTIVFIFSRMPLFNLITNEGVRGFILSVVPFNGRATGFVGNANTYAHLISYSIYTYLFLIVYYKIEKRLQNILIILAINNVFNLFLTGSRTAIFAFFVSMVLFLIIFLTLLIRNSYYNLKLINQIVFYSIGGFIIFLILVFNSDAPLFIDIKSFIINIIIRLGNLDTGSGRFYLWKSLLSIDKKHFILGVSDSQIYNLTEGLLSSGLRASFINNTGRYHNMYLTLFANYGIFAFAAFMYFLIYSIILIIKNYLKSSFRRKRFILFFGAQFVCILICGIFEQLPLFNLSPHSLLFMYTWAALLGLSELNSRKK